MIDLTSYSSIETAILIKWEVPNFSTAYLSDYNSTIVFDGQNYTNIGNLLSVSGTISELKNSPGDVTIGLSGVPTGSISTLLAQQVKGSVITIYRVFLDPTTHNPIDISPDSGTQDVAMKFKGVVTNYSISDSVDVTAQLAVTTITLNANSLIEVLSNKVVGRKTNPTDFASEKSMDRVRALANSNFNFGAP